jgi:tetratricopeptide (TPR) repeat protein
VVIDHPDGTVEIITPPATPQVLAEYVEALREHPDHADLHLYYGLALASVGDAEGAFREVQRAAALDPASIFARSMLAHFYRQRGDPDGALAEYREALRVIECRADREPDQREVTLRWGLAEALKAQGFPEAGREELERAIAIQQEAVRQEAGSPHLLAQLEKLQANWE